VITRREWLLHLGGGIVLAGSSGIHLDAAELPPGVYEASREHLGHALAGHPVAVGGETELVQVRTGIFQNFFSADQYRVIVQLTALLLGESPDAPVTHEVAEWVDLTVSEAAGVRAAARALSPAHRTLAIHYYGAKAVRELEEFEAQQVVRDGLAWLNAESRKRFGHGFSALEGPEQAAIFRSISDDGSVPRADHAGTRIFAYLKERVIDGFYTSRAGLEELGYRGNGFYASPPGCEHLHG